MACFLAAPVKTKLQNAISLLQMIESLVRECGFLIGSGDGLSPVRR